MLQRHLAAEAARRHPHTGAWEGEEAGICLRLIRNEGMKMKAIAATVLLLLVLLFSTAEDASARGKGGGYSRSGRNVHVDSYTRKDGTYVAPYYRSAPDASVTSAPPIRWMGSKPVFVGTGATSSETANQGDPTFSGSESSSSNFWRNLFGGGIIAFLGWWGWRWRCQASQRELEAARVAAIATRIGEIRNRVNAVANQPATFIRAELVQVRAMVLAPADFDEFLPDAITTLAETRSALETLLLEIVDINDLSDSIWNFLSNAKKKKIKELRKAHTYEFLSRDDLIMEIQKVLTP